VSELHAGNLSRHQGPHVTYNAAMAATPNARTPAKLALNCVAPPVNIAGLDGIIPVGEVPFVAVAFMFMGGTGAALTAATTGTAALELAQL